MIKVAYIIPTLSLGGAEKQQINILNGMNSERFKIKIYVLKNKTQLVPLIKNSQIDVEVCSIDSFIEIRALFKFLKDIKAFNPDIIHSQMYNANILSRFIKMWLSKTKLVNHYHGMSDWMTKPKLYLDKITSSMVDRFIVVSKKSFDVRLEREGYPEEKMVLLYNSVDLKPSNKNAVPLKKDILTIGMASRLIPLKNIDGAIYMMSELIKKGFKLKLLIAGEGPEKKNIQQYASDLGLSDKVNLLGFVSEMEKFYEKIDIYCISSTTEDLPLSIVEAMMSGKAVLASNVGGIPGIVKDLPCTMLINDFKNLDEIHEIAEFLKTLEINKCRKTLIEYAMNTFDNRSYCLKLEQLYNTLLNNI